MIDISTSALHVKQLTNSDHHRVESVIRFYPRIILSVLFWLYPSTIAYLMFQQKSVSLSNLTLFDALYSSHKNGGKTLLYWRSLRAFEIVVPVLIRKYTKVLDQLKTDLV